MLSTRTAIALAVFIASAPAYADITISTAATQNMSCSGGVCAPTATDAVLNVTHLENLLGSGNVEVTTTGSGVQANDIVVAAKVVWKAQTVLKLDAYQSLLVRALVSIKGHAGLTLSTNDGGRGGELSIARGGRITFSDLESALQINGSSFVLVDSVQALASGFAQNYAGHIALANNYDASADGTYSAPPISFMGGNFDGLGNTISNLTIHYAHQGGGSVIGLFGSVDGGSIEHSALSNVEVTSTADGDAVGALVGLTAGSTRLFEDHVGGSVVGADFSYVGGLVGENEGVALNSSASGTVAVGNAGIYEPFAGGLVGWNQGTIETSYASDGVSGGESSGVGGLVGLNESVIKNSYATGALRGDKLANVGGLVGMNANDGQSVSITRSYATGSIHGAEESIMGGFVGDNQEVGTIRFCYWDTRTTGLNWGAGNGDDSGMTGLTTAEFQSRLPSGFGKKVWSEKSGINRRLPYLIATPPPK